LDLHAAASVDNSNGDVHDNFTYTIRDGDGDTSPATQPICIQDGATPEAFDNKQCVNEGATQNVMIIADVSGSMDDSDIDPVTPGTQTRLDLEKASLTALVDKYAALDGTVTITLIAFASGGAGAENLPAAPTTTARGTSAPSPSAARPMPATWRRSPPSTAWRSVWMASPPKPNMTMR